MVNRSYVDYLFKNNYITQYGEENEFGISCKFFLDGKERDCNLLTKGKNALLGSAYKNLVVRFVADEMNGEQILSARIYSYAQNAESADTSITIVSKDKNSLCPQIILTNKKTNNLFVGEYDSSVPFSSNNLRDYQIMADWFGSLKCTQDMRELKELNDNFGSKKEMEAKQFLRRLVTVDTNVISFVQQAVNSATKEKSTKYYFDKNNDSTQTPVMKEFNNYYGSCCIKKRKHQKEEVLFE